VRSDFCNGLTIAGWTFDEFDVDDEEFDDPNFDDPVVNARLAADFDVDTMRDSDLNPAEDMVITLSRNVQYSIHGNHELRLFSSTDTAPGNLTILGEGVLAFTGTGGNSRIVTPFTGYNCDLLDTSDAVFDSCDEDIGGIAIRNLLVDKSGGGLQVVSEALPDEVDPATDETTVIIFNRLYVDRGSVAVDDEVDLFYLLSNQDDDLDYGFIFGTGDQTCEDDGDTDDVEECLIAPNGDNTNSGGAESNETALHIDEGLAITGAGDFRINTDGYEVPFPDDHFFTSGQGSLLMNLLHEGSPDVEDDVIDLVGDAFFKQQGTPFIHATVIGFPVVGNGQLSENVFGYLVFAHDDGQTIAGGLWLKGNTYTVLQRVFELQGDFINEAGYAEFLSGTAIEGEFIFRDEECFPEEFELPEAAANKTAGFESVRCQPVVLFAEDTHMGTDPSGDGAS